MHADLILTLEGDTRTVHLGHAERVVGLDTEQALNTATLLLRMRLGTDAECTELCGGRVYPLLLEHLGQTDGIGRNSMESCRTKVLDKLDLTLGVTSCGRHRHRTQPLSTILEAETAGKHTIAGRVLEHVALTAAHHIEVAGNHIGPRADIVLGIDNDTGITCGTTGRVDAHGIVQISAYQSVGIVVAQVLLRGEGDLAKIVERIDGIGRDTEFTETLLVEGRVQADLDGLLEFLHLQLLELLSWHRLYFRLPVLTIGLDG